METPQSLRDEANEILKQMDNPPSLAELRAEAAEILRKVRIEKQPTRRGIMICGEFMGKMLQLGWDNGDLDSIEILFWGTRDADGRMLPSAADQVIKWAESQHRPLTGGWRP